MSDELTLLQQVSGAPIPLRAAHKPAVAPLQQPLRPLRPERFVKTARDEDAKLAQMTQDFEALLVKQMFASMRHTVSKDDKGFGEAMFTDMLDDQLSAHVAESGGLGLADSLKTELANRAQGLSTSVDVVPEKGGVYERRTTQR